MRNIFPHFQTVISDTYITSLNFISIFVVLFRLHYDSNEELVNWKNAMEESITEGLAEDSVLNDVYENHSNRYCADCGSPGYYTLIIDIVKM